MTHNDADRRLTAWLEAAAPVREPDHLLDAVLERTARTPRRPAWMVPQRWIDMTTLSTRAVVGGRFPWQLAAATVLLVLVLVAGAALLAGSRPAKVPPPFGPASNGAFAYDIGGDILARDALTGEITTLVADPGLQIAPKYSLDGTRLAWLHATDPAAVQPTRVELRVAQADGTDVQSLGTFQFVLGGAWSPSGDVIAMELEIDGVTAISMVDVRTGEITPLDLGMPVRHPAFRPGGEQLLFAGKPSGGAWGFYLAGVDGSNPVPLKLDPGFEDDRFYLANQDYYFLSPAWSPEGDRLAFHTLDDETLATEADPGWRVHIVDIDATGGATNEIVLPVDPSIDDEFNAAWLPTGDGLVVQRLEEGAPSLAAWSIDGSSVPSEIPLGLPAETPTLEDVWFSISPDGRQVAMWEPLGSSWLLPLDGGPAVPTSLAIDWDASWQRLAP